MATIKKHVSKAGKVTYYIRTYDGYDSKGKQIERSMTWKPPENMTAKQIEKELQRQAVMFEESVKKGTCFDSDTRFAEYAEIWLENNKPILAPKTYERYKALLKNINTAIGEIKLVKLQSHHLIEIHIIDKRAFITLVYFNKYILFLIQSIISTRLFENQSHISKILEPVIVKQNPTTVIKKVNGKNESFKKFSLLFNTSFNISCLFLYLISIPKKYTEIYRNI